MTQAQRFLLDAARDARDYCDAKVKGTIGVTFRGGESHSAIFIGRALNEAIKAVEAEAQREFERRILDELNTP